MTGVINGQEFGMATLNISVLQQGSSEAPTIWSSISHVPASVGMWGGGGALGHLLDLEKACSRPSTWR